MSINIKIADPPENDNIKINIQDPTMKKMFEFKLHLRKALNGDLMIFDHRDIDIIIMLEKKKVVAFAKDVMTEVVYGASSRLLEYLRRKGIVAYDSIQGGNVYGSLEGKILDSTDLDSVKASLFEISEWMDSERPYFSSMEAHDEMYDDFFVDPDGEHSTELGEVPHAEEKGSILQHNLFAPYLYGRYTY